MVKRAGLIFLTVGLGWIFVYAAKLALVRMADSPLDGAVLTGYDSVPSDTPVVFVGNPYGPGNTPIWWVPNRTMTPVQLATNHGSLARVPFVFPPSLLQPNPALFSTCQSHVYKTAPYTMLVLAPGPMPDGHMVKRVGSMDRMPILRPELRFIPRQ